MEAYIFVLCFHTTMLRRNDTAFISTNTIYLYMHTLVYHIYNNNYYCYCSDDVDYYYYYYFTLVIVIFMCIYKYIFYYHYYDDDYYNTIIFHFLLLLLLLLCCFSYVWPCGSSHIRSIALGISGSPGDRGAACWCPCLRSQAWRNEGQARAPGLYPMCMYVHTYTTYIYIYLYTTFVYIYIYIYIGCGSISS